jgi:hypothetical protein
MKYEILARNLHEAIGLKLGVKNQHVYLTDLGGAVYRYTMSGGRRGSVQLRWACGVYGDCVESFVRVDEMR